MSSNHTSNNRRNVQSLSLFRLLQSLLLHKSLISQMVKREVLGRYKGSMMGLAWSFFNPILMLSVYTFIFSVVFRAKWGIGESETKTQFAIVLFVGMIVHGLFAEVLNKAPALISANANFVKKVVFPLELLPVISLGGALFHSLISLMVLLIAFLLLNGFIHTTFLLFPVVIFPLLLLVLGCAWFLAALGVYLRDVNQVVGIATTVLMFLAPVFYPITSVPESLHFWIYLNPLTFIIEQSRAVIIFGQIPDWSGLFVYTAIAVSIAWIGFIVFQKTRKGFADVL